jgi:hypothetical protein
VKFVVLLLCALGLLVAQEREGSFDIRFEPDAKLQTGIDIPFRITVKDSLRNPLTGAKVTLQIETADHQNVKLYPAPAVQAGVYVAKPVFTAAGQWNVDVVVRRSGARSTRTIQFNVPQ